jgi:hypothetical protein
MLVGCDEGDQKDDRFNETTIIKLPEGRRVMGNEMEKVTHNLYHVFLLLDYVIKGILIEI